jgi:hypothetical protein
MVQAMWETGKLSTEFKFLKDDPNIGSGFMALLITIRADPTLSRMGKSEFIEMASRICEQVFQAYFEQRMKSETR